MKNGNDIYYLRSGEFFFLPPGPSGYKHIP